ncbi:hypothetical protein RS130_07315 [Paraglaciecola aquimarina]|uniref:Uncharacterized protein n=1 Tax=Paraglaciecola aquimarina TaxID=1235557 RepID=A0ABU3SUU0_9ALTE|nr:hypothetical protein [Paraglaciecola aquimarina]MDU0353756.1 hypothetical protein [Paraglaciecola aquimarina]
MIFTGEITDAIYISVENEPKVNFVYGTIVSDGTERLAIVPWISTSPIIKLQKIDGGFAAMTQNSVYFLKSYESVSVTWDEIDIIRIGTPPKLALKLFRAQWPRK